MESKVETDVPLWMEALSPIRNFSKEAADNVFCHVSMDTDGFDASATPINNVWHATWVGPMWSQVGVVHLKKGKNRLCVGNLKPGARIDRMFLGLWPPFCAEPMVRIAAANCSETHPGREGSVCCVDQLGYTDGLLVQPFDTPSYDAARLDEAPWVAYDIDVPAGSGSIEIRTLPTLHVYEGREARYAVQLGDLPPVVCSIHAGDFTAEWRLNVLRGYASRKIAIPAKDVATSQRLKIWLLDPGIVLQEVLVWP